MKQITSKYDFLTLQLVWCLIVMNENKFDESAFFVLLLLSHKAPGYTNLLGNLNPRVLKRESKKYIIRVSESTFVTRDWDKKNFLNP